MGAQCGGSWLADFTSESILHEESLNVRARTTLTGPVVIPLLFVVRFFWYSFLLCFGHRQLLLHSTIDVVCVAYDKENDFLRNTVHVSGMLSALQNSEQSRELDVLPPHVVRRMAFLAGGLY